MSQCLRFYSSPYKALETATLLLILLSDKRDIDVLNGGSGQVRSECLTCTFRASCCSARMSRAQVPALRGGGGGGGGGG